MLPCIEKRFIGPLLRATYVRHSLLICCCKDHLNVQLGVESDAIIDRMHNILQLCLQGSSTATSWYHIYSSPPTDIRPHLYMAMLRPNGNKNSSLKEFWEPLRFSIMYSTVAIGIWLLGVAMIIRLRLIIKPECC